MFDEPRATMAAPPPTGASFRLFGIPVRLNLSFLLVAGVFLYAPGRPASTMLTLMGIVSVSILWHELGHAAAARAERRRTARCCSSPRRGRPPGYCSRASP